MFAVGTVTCAPGGPTIPGEGNMTLSLSSPVFQEGENIPVEYRCDGQVAYASPVARKEWVK